MNSESTQPESLALGEYSDYGCKVNGIPLPELFQRYRQAGFLYEDKIRRLEPFWGLICDNWQKSLRGGELIHFVVTAEIKNAWASVTSWRSTFQGWNTQHLVGTGGPRAARAVMLSTQAARIRYQSEGSLQNWFQRSNRFANRVFGTIDSSLGSDVSYVSDNSFFMFPLAQIDKLHQVGNAGGRDLLPSDVVPFRCFVERARSSAFVAAEELNEDDVFLEALDNLYREVGLRRYRRILICDLPGMDQPAGVALVFRGPLGMNFSFLENRCDLIISPSLTPPQRQLVIAKLLTLSANHYTTFELQSIPVIIAPEYAPDLTAMGGNYVRDYAQSIWLRRGFEQWYRHVERIYTRVMRAEV